MSDSGSPSISVVLMRGGTSKGVFVREADLPPRGAERDAYVLALLGSPDPMQIDGLGGTHSSTSKLMAISSSTREDSDVDYLFAQVGIDKPIVDYAGNCGNLTAAVGAYAVDEGLVPATEPVCLVRLFNKNTGRRVLAHVPVSGGRAQPEGSFALAGVPGTGAPLVTEYLDPAGAVTGALLPTGRPVQTVRPRIGPRLEVSIVDASAPVVFVRPGDVGVSPDIAPAEINADAELLARLESVRAACAVELGFAADEDAAATQSAALPRLLLTHPATGHRLATGEDIEGRAHDLLVRAMSLQRAHHACPLTTVLCTAAAANTAGTIACEAMPGPSRDLVRIAHAKGIVEARVQLDQRAGAPHVTSISVVRTARRLLEGTAHVPPVGARAQAIPFNGPAMS